MLTDTVGIFAACSAPCTPARSRRASWLEAVEKLSGRRPRCCPIKRTQHSGDMAAQLEMALDNLDAILDAADMTAANVVRLNAYTTDIDELFKRFPRIADR